MYLSYNTERLSFGTLKDTTKKMKTHSPSQTAPSHYIYQVTREVDSCLQNPGFCYLTTPYITLSEQGILGSDCVKAVH